MLKISDTDFERMVSFMYNNYGVDLSKKRQLIEGRLHGTVLGKGYTSFTDYVNYVTTTKDRAEVELLINRLTTNHTYFMRESSHFDMFKNAILPDLEGRKRSRVLGIWSAGCSSGEEPYTLSMILKDYFENKPGWDTRVLATDISQRALDIAKAAAYKAEALSEVPTVWRSRYFTKSGDDYTLVPAIRNNVIFKTFNLMSPINFKIKFDVIFCRNVMIYFDRPTKDALIRRFYEATEDGGYLLIGHSETLTKGQNPYKYLDVASYVKL